MRNFNKISEGSEIESQGGELEIESKGGELEIESKEDKSKENELENKIKKLHEEREKIVKQKEQFEKSMTYILGIAITIIEEEIGRTKKELIELKLRRDTNAVEQN